MILDAHQHFWEYNPVKDAWIDESMEVIRRDFLPGDLLPVLQANNVDGCIAIQADQSEKETGFLLKCAKKNKFIKGVVGWIDLLNENVEERLAYFSQDKLFKGVRHIVQAETNDYFMLQPDFQNGIGKLEHFNLTYDILVYQHQLPAAIEMVKRFPNQLFVLDHMAKPRISDGLDEGWKRNIQELANYENVYCKLSGMVTETEDFKWEKPVFTAFLDVVIDAFGVDRVLYGSDWPVCLLAAEYEQQLGILEDYITKFSSEEKTKIMGENAMSFYNL